MLAPGVQRRHAGLEMLDAQGLGGPVAAGGFQAVDHALRAAAVDLRAGLDAGKQLRVVGAPALFFHIAVQALAVQRFQFVQPGHALARASAVVKFIVQAAFARAQRHRRDRRDAYAAGNQHHARRHFVKVEMVARATHAQALASAQLRMQPARAAPAVWVVQHRDFPAAGLGRVAAQRILARDAAVAAFHVDVRTRRPARQRGAVRRDQAYAQHIVGNRVHAQHLQQAVDALARRLAQAQRQPGIQQVWLRTFRVLRRVPFHPQVLGSTERGVGQVGEALLGQAHVRQTACEFFQKDLQLQPRQVLAHALVRAVAKGQVLAGVVAVNVKQVGVGKARLVVVGRGHHDQQLGAGRDRHATHVHVTRGQTPPGRHRAVVAQAFFDRIGYQAGVIADFAPDPGVLQQQLERVGRGV